MFITLSFSAYSVLTPSQGITSLDGRYVYFPSQTASYGQAIRAVNAQTGVEIGKVSAGLYPYSMVAHPNGTHIIAAGGTNVISYTIQPSGTLVALGIRFLGSGVSARGSAITMIGSTVYLYVADSANKTVQILNVTNPASMTIAASFTITGANSIYGVAVNPLGTRLYVSNRESGNGRVYVYDISGAYKTSPQYIGAISMPNLSPASYMAFDPDGDKLFVRIYETVSPYRDVQVYAASRDAFSVISEVYKIKGNPPAFRVGPINHVSTDIDTNNNYEGLTLSPNGWFMYYSHFNGPSGSGLLYYYDSLYGTSVNNLNNGYDPANTGDIWVSYGGSTVEGIYGGWHSTDGITATRFQKVYFSYSDGASYLSVPTSSDSNAIPAAPKITYPLPDAINVSGYITWEPSLDDSPNLNYEVQFMSTFEAGLNTWHLMGYSSTNEPYVPFTTVTSECWYYFRVHAYDGTYSSAWSYTGPVHMRYMAPPGWVDSYNETATTANILWGSVVGIDHYVVAYKPQYASTWATVETTSTTMGLSSLTAMTTYEVMVKSVTTTPTTKESAYSSIHRFYTLERPWIDVPAALVSVESDGSSASVYILWGPEITGGLTVPNAFIYNCEIRSANTPAGPFTAWANVGNLLNQQDDPAIPSNNYRMTGLLPDKWYEIRMRSVDSTGGASKWTIF